MTSKRILFIHAHPDDIEILAGGAATLLKRAGHAVEFVSMTPGDCGSAEHSAEEIAAIRRAEGARAAALIDVPYRCAEFRDLSIFCDDPSRRRVCEILREARPDLVLTSSPKDYMADHEATSALVRDACFAVSAKNYTSGLAAPLDRIPHLYYMDPVDESVEVDCFIDVTSVFETKREMLACHASQREWLRRQHGMDDYLIQMESWSRARGSQCGATFAEGFRKYKGHPYPQSLLLEELLREFVR